jgi:putative glutamine amidotransferase
MSRPVIGVTASEIRRKGDVQHVRHGEPTQTEMTLGLSYMRAVEMAGGLPVALPPLSTENVERLLDHLSGLLLTGGPDLDPSTYGAAPDPELGPTDPVVDAFELELCRHAYRRQMPILGICRGAQLLNVARQGTLHQHVPDFVNGTIEHRQAEPGTRTSHEVRVAPDSSLARTTGGGPVRVNSFHHQGIDRIGFGMRAVAWSEDGLIEAIEEHEGRFILGVQWHAETLLADPVQLSLFERLVDAADYPGRPAPRERALPRSGEDRGEQEDFGARAV